MTEEPERLLDASDYERWAAAHLDGPTFDFVAGGAGRELTLDDNVAAFQRRRLVPRTLRDVSAVSTGSTAFGTSLTAPLFISPMGMQRLVHEEAELGMARAARDVGIGFTGATASTHTIEEIAAEGGRPLWFQLYWRRDREITRDLVARAAEAGYEAVVLTVDTPVVGRRLRDARNRYQRPPTITYANFARYEDSNIKDKSGDAPTYYVADQMDRTLTWKDLEWLRDASGLPIVLKGILAAEDARSGIDAGASGIMVSNHGGRQLDQVPATIDVLDEIADAVGDDGIVVIDGGVRTAADVLIALAIGADVVSIGRPALWALAHGGSTSVKSFLQDLIDDLARSMTLLGARSITELDRSFVRQNVRLARISATAE